MLTILKFKQFANLMGKNGMQKKRMQIKFHCKCYNRFKVRTIKKSFCLSGLNLILKTCFLNEVLCSCVNIHKHIICYKTSIWSTIFYSRHWLFGPDHYNFLNNKLWYNYKVIAEWNITIENNMKKIRIKNEKGSDESFQLFM